MNVPESWLRSFCDPALPGQALADRLTMAGIEVEAYEPCGAQFSGVVVGEIVSVERHPGADKLTICRVNDGATGYQVVCGAPNARAGMKAPLARVGARLPGMASWSCRRRRSRAWTCAPCSASTTGSSPSS
jgi:phenylalanyl-tRNA synthetase beta chain